MALEWLKNLRVLDLTTELGTLGVRVLAAYGAQVTRIEAPAGDPLRRRPPLAGGPDGSEHSIYWLHMMHGRTVKTIDFATAEGRAEFEQLAAECDVVFESQPLGWFADMGIDEAALRAANPRLTWVSVSPFGRTGPRANWQATDLIGMAAGGLMTLCGDRDLPPLRMSVEQGYAQAGLQALAGLMIALREVRRGNPGQLIDVSMQAAITNTLGNARLYYELEQMLTVRAGGGRAFGSQGSRLVYPCADGYISFSRTPDALQALYDWMVAEGVEPGFDVSVVAMLPQASRGVGNPEVTAAFESAVSRLFLALPKLYIYEEGQRRGIMTCPVSNPADLLQNRQLTDRGYWQTEHFAELGREAVVPGLPVMIESVPAGTAAIPRRVQAPASGLPLYGLRVADFSWVGVAPCATQQLALFGAEVIRVESARKLDVFRGSGPKRGADPNASAYWANCNRDKKDITLDLRHPRGREVALRLIAESDIVVDSFTPGFMETVGLSLEEMRKANPNIIKMTASMEGSTGPHARFKGFGLVLQSTVGFTHFTAWPGRTPVGTGVAYTDWFATHLASFAIMAAIEAYERDGEAASIDLSQLEACIWGLDAEVLRYTLAGEQRPAIGNRHEAMAPHGVFPCSGEDEWVAIACRDDADWVNLSQILGNRVPGDLTVAGRKTNEDEIEAALGAWTSGQSADDVAVQLQSAGIPAYAVLSMAAVENDIQLRAREQFWPLVHPELGMVDWDSPAYRLSNLDLRHRLPAPCLGADNDYVYRTVLGYDDETLASLIADGVLE